jgi:hypothetical protein
MKKTFSAMAKELAALSYEASVITTRITKLSAEITMMLHEEDDRAHAGNDDSVGDIDARPEIRRFDAANGGAKR